MLRGEVFNFVYTCAIINYTSSMLRKKNINALYNHKRYVTMLIIYFFKISIVCIYICRIYKSLRENE